eukprot:8122937-Lingulodinium_polyedra.AAC.1
MYRSGSAMTSPGRGTPSVVATLACACRRSARAAGGRLRIAAGVHCRCVRFPPRVVVGAWIMAWYEMP